ALAAMAGRLWAASLVVYALFVLVRRLPPTAAASAGVAGDEPPRDTTVQIAVLNPALRPALHAPLAVPALFGRLRLGPVAAALAPRVHVACLVARGGCPFDQKVYALQLAGCDSVIVHNNGSMPAHHRAGPPGADPAAASSSPTSRSAALDLPVRMSAHTIHSLITVQAMFLTQVDAGYLRRLARMAHDAANETLLIQMTPTEWGGFLGSPAASLWSLALDMVFLVLSAVICSTCFLTLCLVLSVARNLVVFGQLCFIETLVEGSLIILAQGPYAPPPQPPPKLRSVPFPLRVLTALDLEGIRDDDSDSHDDDKCAGGTDGLGLKNAAARTVGDPEAPPPKRQPLSWGQGGVGISRDCCAICLDDFVVGSRVRDLPCRHIFHDVCIDPWLLKHNRLCPICKRDVLDPGLIPGRDDKSGASNLHQGGNHGGGLMGGGGDEEGAMLPAVVSDIESAPLVRRVSAHQLYLHQYQHHNQHHNQHQNQHQHQQHYQHYQHYQQQHQAQPSTRAAALHLAGRVSVLVLRTTAVFVYPIAVTAAAAVHMATRVSRAVAPQLPSSPSLSSSSLSSTATAALPALHGSSVSSESAASATVAATASAPLLPAGLDADSTQWMDDAVGSDRPRLRQLIGAATGPMAGYAGPHDIEAVDRR
ncbi:hypothetical protein HK105_204389, partial [Polyrhizophydium stewartii]